MHFFVLDSFSPSWLINRSTQFENIAHWMTERISLDPCDKLRPFQGRIFPGDFIHIVRVKIFSKYVRAFRTIFRDNVTYRNFGAHICIGGTEAKMHEISKLATKCVKSEPNLVRLRFYLSYPSTIVSKVEQLLITSDSSLDSSSFISNFFLVWAPISTVTSSGAYLRISNHRPSISGTCGSARYFAHSA